LNTWSVFGRQNSLYWVSFWQPQHPLSGSLPALLKLVPLSADPVEAMLNSPIRQHCREDYKLLSIRSCSSFAAPL
jgi:hypothetical protein